MKSALMRAGYKKFHKQMNDVFLQFTSKVIFFIILMFAFNLFFAGHYTPGGGFVGGLLVASAIILMLIAFDRKSIQKMIPVNFRFVITLGLAFVTIVPTLSFLFGTPFFKHQYTYVNIPVFGEVSLHSAVLFDIGVLLIVAAAVLSILLLAGEDKS